ncbi:MAG TPA: hypothetical protein VMS38_31250, partial [Pseudorhodoferax sp.]|nr:hypothetical protein [Pseudorhodoferax sp.]
MTVLPGHGRAECALPVQSMLAGGSCRCRTAPGSAAGYGSIHLCARGLHELLVLGQLGLHERAELCGR